MHQEGGETRQKSGSDPVKDVELFPKSIEKLLSVSNWMWLEQICIFKGSL